MHAIVVQETGQSEAIAGSEAHLAAKVVPAVRAAPGAVSALWMTDGSGRFLNVLVFDSEEAARAALDPVRNAPRAGFVKLESAEVYRVLANF